MILGILFCVIPTFLHADGWLGDGGAYGIVWFIYLFLMGGYIRKYYSDGGKKACLYYLASILLIPFSKFIILFVGRSRFINAIFRGETVFKISKVFYFFNSLPAFCASVFLFCFFCSVRIENEKLAKLINSAGGLTFGIYLVHNNRNLASVIWGGVRTNYWLAEKEDIFAVIGIWMSVFIVCGIVEAFRQCLFKCLKIDSLINKLAYFLKAVGGKVLNFSAGKEIS